MESLQLYSVDGSNIETSVLLFLPTDFIPLTNLSWGDLS